MTDEQRIIKILADTVCKSDEGITGATTLTEDLGLESLDMVEAVSEIEANFGIRISDDEAAGVSTVADVVALVAKNTAKT